MTFESRTKPFAGPFFRFWMTGSVAVVMAALCYARLPARDTEDDKHGSTPRALRHSAFGVGETVLRIESAVRERGLTVIARLDGAQPVLVLGSAGGVTPVLMRDPDSPPDVLYAVHLREGDDGRAEVYLGEATPGLPQEVARDLAALPALLDGALGPGTSAT